MNLGLSILGIAVLQLISCVSVAQDGTDDQGKVAPELAGKWCYLPPTAESTESLTNTCITLNPDGTYDVQVDPSAMNGMGTPLGSIQNSDSGTWTVLGNRIFYSSTARGKGSFRFQKANHPRLDKTPVLLVDGVVFCSATPRDPW